MNIRPDCEQYMCMDAQNQHFESWDEIRIAYQLACLGSLSAAAEFLGVHHATVIRHVDTLEKRLDPNMVQAFTKFLKEQFAIRQAKCKPCEGNL